MPTMAVPSPLCVIQRSLEPERRARKCAQMLHSARGGSEGTEGWLPTQGSDGGRAEAGQAPAAGGGGPHLRKL